MLSAMLFTENAKNDFEIFDNTNRSSNKGVTLDS